MDEKLQNLLKIPASRLEEINSFLLDPEMTVMKEFLEVVAKYGTPEEINRKAAEASKLSSLRQRGSTSNPEYLKDLDWLIEQREARAFISVEEYRRAVLGEKMEDISFKDEYAVTLEINACQYFA